MKRDMDLVRELLLAVEGAEQAGLAKAPKLAGHGEEEISYHVSLLVDAQYLSATVFRPLSGVPSHHNIALTWRGHEFLDTVRDPEIWGKAKAGASKVGSWSMGLLAELAKAALTAKAKDLGLLL